MDLALSGSELGVSSYPSNQGVYRLTGNVDLGRGPGKAWGTLIIYGKGYVTHIVRTENELYVGNTADSITLPSKWARLNASVETGAVEAAVNTSGKASFNFKASHPDAIFVANIMNNVTISNDGIENNGNTGWVTVNDRNLYGTSIWIKYIVVDVSL